MGQNLNSKKVNIGTFLFAMLNVLVQQYWQLSSLDQIKVCSSEFSIA